MFRDGDLPRQVSSRPQGCSIGADWLLANCKAVPFGSGDLYPALAPDRDKMGSKVQNAMRVCPPTADRGALLELLINCIIQEDCDM